MSLGRGGLSGGYRLAADEPSRRCEVTRAPGRAIVGPTIASCVDNPTKEEPWHSPYRYATSP